MQSSTHELGDAKGGVNIKGIIQGAKLTKLQFLYKATQSSMSVKTKR